MTLITLPDLDTMRANLYAVCEIRHIRERLFPMFLANAGQEKYGIGVALMIELALADYLEGMPRIMGTVLRLEVPKWLRALVPDNDAARQEAADALTGPS